MSGTIPQAVVVIHNENTAKQKDWKTNDYQPYQRIAFIIIEFIRAGIIVFTTGFLMHYLFYFINEIIHKLQMNNISVKIRGKKK